MDISKFQNSIIIFDFWENSFSKSRSILKINSTVFKFNGIIAEIKYNLVRIMITSDKLSRQISGRIPPDFCQNSNRIPNFWHILDIIKVTSWPPPFQAAIHGNGETTRSLSNETTVPYGKPPYPEVDSGDDTDSVAITPRECNAWSVRGLALPTRLHENCTCYMRSNMLSLSS